MKLLKYRYPKVFDDKGVKLLQAWLAADGHEQGEWEMKVYVYCCDWSLDKFDLLIEIGMSILKKILRNTIHRYNFAMLVLCLCTGIH